ncbi:MAG: hypothetical protein D6772_04055, partial [Bacteroidetes bacterium]
ADYQAAVRAYEAAVAERESRLAAGRDSLQAAFQARKEALKASFRDQLRQSVNKYKRRVVNRFVINDFGVWNCARPIEQKATASEIRYRAADGAPIRGSIAYVVSTEYNTLFRYYADEGASLGIMPGQPNLVWVVRDGALLLTHITQLGDGSELVLETVHTPRSEAELRKLLNL